MTRISKQHAAGLGLDTKQFNACVDTHKLQAQVDADMEAGEDAGVNGTPAFFVNGRMLNGAQPFDAFKRVIDEELELKKNNACLCHEESQVRCRRRKSSAVQTDAEPMDDAVGNGEEARRQADDRHEHVIATFARQWVEKGRYGVTARESAGVRIVVDAAHGEAHHHQHQGVL
mgnify:CR=1 FL=1